MKRRILLSFVFFISSFIILTAQSIVTTKHNLSVSSTGKIKATSETEICLFCHTPHNSRPVAPLWNRNDPGSMYTLYSSSTLQSLPGQPDGSSILCLSCHDGTIALGNVISRTANIEMTSGSFMPAGHSNFGNNLSKNHPISFTYRSDLALNDGQLKNPSAITPPVALKNSKVQCTSCHDPHKNIYSDFLVAAPQNSNLCNSCHQRTNWAQSSHNLSTKTWNGVAPNPWPYSDRSMTTVGQNGCESCHNPHNSESKSMLLKYSNEENNCLDCHNGNVASKDIRLQFMKPYRHNVFAYTGIHNANESGQVNSMHVECEDCHNPHQSNNQTAVAPFASGALKGVKGVNRNGSPVKEANEAYEICYRCHAGNAGAPASPTNRIINQNNVRLEFADGNPSFHAVAAQGVNPNVPSLISPWTASSRLYCTDCHASDDPNAPSGPHGSNYPHILKLQYLTGVGKIIESSSAYALCYNCHSRTSILSDVSFKEHSKHIQGENFSCNNCHDPHGISSSQGNGINNTNLINFNSAVVYPNSKGKLYFMDQGLFHGKCSLKCHNKDHDDVAY